jgi:hypothetical protein
MHYSVALLIFISFIFFFFRARYKPWVDGKSIVSTIQHAWARLDWAWALIGSDAGMGVIFVAQFRACGRQVGLLHDGC